MDVVVIVKKKDYFRRLLLYFVYIDIVDINLKRFEVRKLFVC